LNKKKMLQAQWLLQHAIVMALKYGFKVYLMGPSRTSKYAMKIHRRIGLDKRMVSVWHQHA